MDTIALSALLSAWKTTMVVVAMFVSVLAVAQEWNGAVYMAGLWHSLEAAQ